MNILKTSLLTSLLSLSVLGISVSQAAEPATIASPKQVAGYYHHQIGNTQITALLDGTNYLNPSMFKGLSDAEKTEILKKYHADQAKGANYWISRPPILVRGLPLILIPSRPLKLKKISFYF